MTPRSFGMALASLLQTRSQTLTFNGVVLNASTDDGYCLVRLDQGGVRHVLVPKGSTVEYGSRVVVTRQAGQSQLTLVGSGNTIISTTVNNVTQQSSGGESADFASGEFLMLDASNGPLTGALDILGPATSQSAETLLRIRRLTAPDEWFGPVADFSLRSYGPAGPPDWAPTSELIIALKSTSDENAIADVELMRLRSNGEIETSAQLISTVPVGEPPFVVSSTTKVDNLNSDLLDGYTAANILSRVWFGA